MRMRWFYKNYDRIFINHRFNFGNHYDLCEKTWKYFTSIYFQALDYVDDNFDGNFECFFAADVLSKNDYHQFDFLNRRRCFFDWFQTVYSRSNKFFARAYLFHYRIFFNSEFAGLNFLSCLHRIFSFNFMEAFRQSENSRNHLFARACADVVVCVEPLFWIKRSQKFVCISLLNFFCRFGFASRFQ